MSVRARRCIFRRPFVHDGSSAQGPDKLARYLADRTADSPTVEPSHVFINVNPSAIDKAWVYTVYVCRRVSCGCTICGSTNGCRLGPGLVVDLVIAYSLGIIPDVEATHDKDRLRLASFQIGRP